MHIHLDPLGGIAGDMFLAALLDAWPEHAEGAFAAMRTGGLPAQFEVGLEAKRDHTFAGQHLIIAKTAEPPKPAGAWAAIRARLEASALPLPVVRHALAIFTLLAEAEGEIHGVPPDAVHFHELAGWDSLADVVGAAYLIDALAATSWSTAPPPLGGGRIDSDHGLLPVPAPATVALLRGFEMLDDGVAGERVTPTGAAILRYLCQGAPVRRPPARLARTGVGFGTRVLPGVSNILRVLAFERGEAAFAQDTVGMIDFEVDDQTPEDLALGLDNLRARDDVLDVVQAAVFGKKGRMLAQIQVICRAEALEATIEACFRETTTIGLRHRQTARASLPRRMVDVAADDTKLTVKRVERPGGPTAKADIEDVRGLDGGHKARAARRDDAAARALKNGSDDDASEDR